jgi:hypothetical protein
MHELLLYEIDDYSSTRILWEYFELMLKKLCHLNK